MTIQLPELPYPHDALEPHVSAETLRFHHGKHHAGYVEKVNEMIRDTPLADAALEDIVRHAAGALFDAAAQAHNHAFYWRCMSPDGGGAPPDDVAAALAASFGSVGAFAKQFTEAAESHFGSGWAWLCAEGQGLCVVATHDALTPILDGRRTPVLTCDVWEHAYYLDHRNDRGGYLEAFWNVVDWQFVRANLKAAGVLGDAAATTRSSA